MDKILVVITTVMKAIVELLLLFVGIVILLQLLFGVPIPFIGVDVIANLKNILVTLGDNGLIGLLAAIVIVVIFQKAKK